MRTLLIANRGEIALRVMRTANALGIRTVAIYTALDATAPHVQTADQSVEVDSYLNIDAVVGAATAVGADAVHPGYGFLSERSEFARALDAAGITLVGPSADVMDRMGRKDAAREIAEAAGVPVVPQGVSSDSTSEVSFPVLVKAAAGGGGKGMRVVRAAGELDEAIAAAAREAKSSFGDDTLLIEKYVERGRHIEVQVFGDTHGNVVHFYERDCSTQRRHQKVLEEAPAPTLSAAQRDGVTSAAVALSQAVGYVGAGTVEFLLDDATGEFYFLEMNTRLQVEHPVTEEIVRVRGERADLVALQLRIADGEALGFAQQDVSTEGHAVEARVYAEDAYAGFLPQAGTARLVEWPRFCRVDHALFSGQVVSTAYDPMLGKVIVWGPDRERARQGLVRALDQTAILGFTTNTGFLRNLAASKAFEDAAIDTAWLDRVDVVEEIGEPDVDRARRVAAEAVAGRLPRSGPFASDGWRGGGPAAPVVVRLDEMVGLDTPLRGPRPATDEAAVVEVRAHEVELALEGQRFLFAEPDPFDTAHQHIGDGAISAPMPGHVLSVGVEPGARVEAGQTLGVLEAMKMELALKSPFAGTVESVNAQVGAQVAMGALLFVVNADA
jgi:acetyl/propionyl-CoA carboxylase alpha subunit